MAGSKRLAERWEKAVHQVVCQITQEKVIPMTIILPAAIISRIFTRKVFWNFREYLRNWTILSTKLKKKTLQNANKNTYNINYKL